MSRAVTRPVVDLLVEQNEGDPQDHLEEALAKQSGLLSRAKRQRVEEVKERQRDVGGQLSPSLQSAVEHATDDGGSSWLSARPIEEHARPIEEPFAMQSHYVMDCGVSFDSCHILRCRKGGLTVARHNEIRDLTANLISEVCSDNKIEPRLQHLSGEQFLLASANRDAEARLDIKARGFWGGGA